ncbi:VCBS repeat-containing protein [Flagellimonas sp. S3867]|uniref:FG-GAP repeat domain-containing protein n=1 Tax=Flagellimonas sp. S3867 TaxID=2768063 RepID=UPI0016882134|nr:VCBS repeat-containing protein [Flagellimonas sp. S3867]
MFRTKSILRKIHTWPAYLFLGFILIATTEKKSLVNNRHQDQSITIVQDTATVFVRAGDTQLMSKNVLGNSMDGEVYDINGDDLLDVVLAMEFERNVVLINQGNGVLMDESDKRFPNTIKDSEDIAMADFDQDGDIDFIFVCEDDRKNEYFTNKGGGYFEDNSSALPVDGISNVVETADINKDGYVDLFIGNQGQNYVLVNYNQGHFMDETALRLPENKAITQDLGLKDIDGDGDLDIIEANEDYNRILINYGKGFFKDESEKRLPWVNDQTREVELADIDNDGDLDIFFANVNFRGFGNPQNRLLLNDGKGFFTEITSTALPKSDFLTVGAKFYDIDDDGYVDLINGNGRNGQQLMVLINDGNGIFHDQTSVFFPEMDCFTFDFLFGDFNEDGRKDVYISNFRGPDILLYRNK